MPTNTAGSVARQYQAQLVHYARFAVNYNDAGISAGVTKQTLPSGALVIGTDVWNSASWNANSTNVLTVGLNGTTANNLVASGDVNEASAQMFSNIAPTTGPLTADTPIYVKYTQTGPTVATSGSATIVVKYIPGNDR